VGEDLAIDRRGAVVALFPAEPKPAPEVGELYRRHWKEICVYLRRRFGAGPPEPEDIAQAAFLRLSGRGETEDLANPRAFLYRVAHNLAIEEHRREVARRRAEADDETDAGTDDFDPERVSIGRERRRLLETAFATLEPRTRQILIMSRQDGLSSAEIARRLRLSPTQVKRLIGEAVARCQAFVDGYDPGGEP
jgi:RNA polymerase sigma factor (sigma-70 family)